MNLGWHSGFPRWLVTLSPISFLSTFNLIFCFPSIELSSENQLLRSTCTCCSFSKDSISCGFWQASCFAVLCLSHVLRRSISLSQIAVVITLRICSFPPHSSLQNWSVFRWIICFLQPMLKEHRFHSLINLRITIPITNPPLFFKNKWTNEE